MNLYQKLVEIRKQVGYIQKDAQGYGYKYAKESELLWAIRPKMDELGVLLSMDMVEAVDVIVEVQNKDKSFSDRKGKKATFVFTWRNSENPEEVDKHQIIVQDAGGDAQTMGGLMTYANRYFLYKFFSIPTDEADPDAYKAKQMGEEEKKEAKKEEFKAKFDQDVVLPFGKHANVPLRDVPKDYLRYMLSTNALDKYPNLKAASEALI